MKNLNGELMICVVMILVLFVLGKLMYDLSSHTDQITQQVVDEKYRYSDGMLCGRQTGCRIPDNTELTNWVNDRIVYIKDAKNICYSIINFNRNTTMNVVPCEGLSL